MKFAFVCCILFSLLTQAQADGPIYLTSRPEISFEDARKSVLKCLGDQPEQYYCVGMHWFGNMKHPENGSWGISFWNAEKQFRWIDVSADGSAQWHQAIERRSWDYVSKQAISMEDAVAIAERYLGPQNDLFLSGGGLDSTRPSCFRVQFYQLGARDYTDLYVTFDGKVHRDQHDIPPIPNFGEGQFLVPPKIIVTAHADFARISPLDDGMEVHFDYKYPTPYLIDPPNTYQCSFDAMTYLITVPDGKRYSLNLVDKKKDTGFFVAVSFNYNTYKIFDSVGAWPGLLDERRFFWKQTDVPTFRVPGTYRIVETGTFHETTGKLPDIAYQSTEAICVVDPKVSSLDELKAKSQAALQSKVEVRIPPVNWYVQEDATGTHTLSGMLEAKVLPETAIAPEQRKKMRGEYSGMRYRFKFTMDGKLLSEEHDPIYMMYD